MTSTPITLPPLDDLIVKKEPLGLLIGESGVLKYYSFEDKSVRKVHDFSDMNASLWSILPSEGEVYCGFDIGKILGLFNKFSTKRDNGVKSLIEHNSKILDSGLYGLYSTLENKVLITRREMNTEGVKSLSSLFTGYDGNLYALVWDLNKMLAILCLDEKAGSYNIGKRVLKYLIINSYVQVISVSGKIRKINRTYPFSVLSCVNEYSLDLKGHKIKGTKVKKGQKIMSIAKLSSSLGKVTVAYSGDFGAIHLAEIDLKKRTAEVSPIVENLTDNVLALAPVYDKKLHEKLISVGAE